MAKYNNKNLVDLRTRDPEEAKKIRAMGGRAAHVARQRNRTFRKIFEAIASEKITVKMPDKSDRETTFDEAAVIATYQRAIKGDQKAMKIILTVLGEYVQKVEAEGINVNVQSSEQGKKNIEKILKGTDEE